MRLIDADALKKDLKIGYFKQWNFSKYKCSIVFTRRISDGL